jgi:alpha-mannosidase
MPHVGSFLESDVPMAAFIYNSPLHGQLSYSDVSALISLMISPVRTVPGQHASHVVPSLPFWLEGAPNIILETIKRGEDDFEPNASSTTVILRLYEAFGGHGSVKLHVGKQVPVKRAYVTNILEDTKGELGLVSTTGQHSTLKLEFRSFEVKTVKLELETESDILDISPT